MVSSGCGADLMLRFRLESGRRWDKALSEDKADAASSSWLYEKDV
jgi:hypothetical protein